MEAYKFVVNSLRRFQGEILTRSQTEDGEATLPRDEIAWYTYCNVYQFRGRIRIPRSLLSVFNQHRQNN